MQPQLAVNMPVAESNAPKAQSPSNPENQANPENPGSDLTPANQPKKPVSAEPIETGPVVIGAPQYAVAEPLKVDIILAAETEARQQLQDLQEQEPQSRGNFASRLAKNLLKVKNGEKPDLQEPKPCLKP